MPLERPNKFTEITSTPIKDRINIIRAGTVRKANKRFSRPKCLISE